jgi:DNA polymerase-3 subunit epsilon
MKIMKVFWLDTETTGLSFFKHDIHQLAGLIVIDGKIVEEFNYNIKPFSFENIEPDALKVSGVTVEQLKTYQDPKNVHLVLIKMMEKYCNKFDKDDKFSLAGQNVPFDANMLKGFFQKCGDKFYGSWFNYDYIDLRALTAILKFAGLLPVENLKLETIAKHLGIEYNAHDALSDIKCTRSCLNTLVSTFFAKPTAKKALKK